METKDLVKCLQNFIDKKVNDLIDEKLIEILELKNEDELNYENNLLRMVYKETDWFNLVVINAIFEQLYNEKIIKEDLTSIRNIPNGADNNYGRYFEEKIKGYLSELQDLSISKNKTTDGIINFKSKQYVLEIKCSKTDTKKQVERYMKETKINDFITVNGHDNSINITWLYIYRLTEISLKNIFSFGREIRSYQKKKNLLNLSEDRFN
jgi:hypothetical protein